MKKKIIILFVFIVLILLHSEKLQAQSPRQFDNWRIVTSKEFERLAIPDTLVQKVDLRLKDNFNVDNSRKGRIYTDKGGETFYWINIKWGTIPNFLPVGNFAQVQAHGPNNSATEDEIERILEIGEMKMAIEGFSNRFKILKTYAYDPSKRNERYEIHVDISYVNPPENLKILGLAFLISDSMARKEVVIYDEAPNNFWIFLLEICYKNTKSAIKTILNYEDKWPLSIQEKVKFLKLYFVDYPNEAIQNLAQYVPPVVKQPEKIPYQPGDNILNFDKGISPRTVIETDVIMNEDSLKKILEEFEDD